jgi:hypothetical protein
MTFYESNPEIRPTGEEAGEFIDGGLLASGAEGGTDPTRRPTGSSPLEPESEDTDAARDPDAAGD